MLKIPAQRTIPYIGVIVARYVYPCLILALLGSVMAFSEVDLNLWVIRGWPAVLVAWTYCGVLVMTMTQPHREGWHQAGSFLALITFAGRAGGFAKVAIDAERWDLIAAVMARVVTMAFVVGWHFLMGVWIQRARRDVR